MARHARTQRPKKLELGLVGDGDIQHHRRQTQKGMDGPNTPDRISCDCEETRLVGEAVFTESDCCKTLI